MKQTVIMEKIDTTIENNASIELCKGEIPGTRAMHHIITAGTKFVFEGNAGYYHIVQSILFGNHQRYP